MLLSGRPCAGRFTNQRFMTQYGFVVPGNTADRLELQLPASPGCGRMPVCDNVHHPLWVHDNLADLLTASKPRSVTRIHSLSHAAQCRQAECVALKRMQRLLADSASLEWCAGPNSTFCSMQAGGRAVTGAYAAPAGRPRIPGRRERAAALPVRCAALAAHA